MKNYNPLILLSILLLTFTSHFLNAQVDFTDKGVEFEVKKIYPYLSVSKADLPKITTIDDFRNEVNQVNYRL